MKRLSVVLLGSALGLLGLTSGARANWVVDYTYNWSPSQSTFTGSQGGLLHLQDEPGAPGENTGPINPAPLGNPNTPPYLNPVATPAAHFFTESNATPQNAETVHGDYTLTMTLNFAAQSHAFHFTGTLDGTMNATSSFLTNTNTGLQTDTWNNVDDGTGHKYNFTVSYDGFSQPGGPHANVKGAISYDVTVTPVGSSNQPEPSTLALAGLGLAGFGFVSWRKWGRSRGMARAL